jgi:imidazolonepropionase-like amidohydrolase
MMFTLIEKIQKFNVVCVIGISLLWIQSCTSDSSSKESFSKIEDEGAYTVIFGGNPIGKLNVSTAGDTILVDYGYKNNGRGPTMKETILLDRQGFPIHWDITGNTTFGNKVDEHLRFEDQAFSWTDASGRGTVTIDRPTLYANQFGSPYSLAIMARALLRAPDLTLPTLPAGQFQLTELESIKTDSGSNEINLKTYALSGADLDPSYLILDEDQRFFASISSTFIIIRAGFEQVEKRMRELAEKYSSTRYKTLQKQFGHNYGGDIRIRNVRIFDPETLTLTPSASVLVRGERIIRVDAADAEGGTNETIIDGAGGTLVAGLYDMHGHVGEEEGLLNVLAGVTSMRDMGNDNDVLDSLIRRIDAGIVAGPRITRLGLIEGKSPFNVNLGILVENEQQALDAVATYAKKGFYGVKLYNSMNGDWAPAIVKKAHELNLRVAGHVPAFSNANRMIRAGFDEMTHINQVMLGWVLKPDEDTRTLLRLTALMRLPGVDLNGPAVKETLDLMVKNNVAIDPTLVIHEALLLSRNGETSVGTLDYIDHMPANVQRNAKVALASIANLDEDRAYRFAYNKIVETLKLMRSRGIKIIPGTDMGGAFTLHRELELYQQLGYSAAELLKLGSYDMAKYLGYKDRGAIEPGMLADFFLVPKDPTTDLKAIKAISMVSRGGVFYYPTEVYPAFGIKPFTEKPAVSEATGKKD